MAPGKDSKDDSGAPPRRRPDPFDDGSEEAGGADAAAEEPERETRATARRTRPSAESRVQEPGDRERRDRGAEEDPDEDRERDRDRERASASDRDADRSRRRDASKDRERREEPAPEDEPVDSPPKRRWWQRRSRAPREDPIDPDPAEEPLEDEPERARDHSRSSTRATGRSGRSGASAEDRDPPRSRSRRRVASLDDYADLSDDELADLPDLPPSALRRPPWWAVLLGLLLLTVVVFVFLGEYNSERYFIVCKGSKAEAHQGRGFPWPFGHRALQGPQYRAVPLSADTQCEPQELASEEELQQSLLLLVMTEVERRQHADKLKDLQRARRLVTQGLSLARRDKKRRKRLQVLRGILDLREGQLRLADVARELERTRRVFLRARKRARAAKGKPKEVAAVQTAIDLVDHLLARIKAGSAPPRPRPPTPVFIPPPRVEPPSVSTPDATDGGVVAPRTPPRPAERPTPAIPSAPDAGVTGGGILL